MNYLIPYSTHNAECPAINKDNLYIDYENWDDDDDISDNTYDFYDYYCDVHDYDGGEININACQNSGKTYKNPFLVGLKNGVIYEKSELKSMVETYSKDYNDYRFMKKVIESKGVNKSVKNLIEYNEFVENITELFDDQEDKKKEFLKLAKKSKKIFKKDLNFEFDISHPSDELVKFVHKKFDTEQEKDADYFFKYHDIKKNCYEGYLIFKIAFKILKNEESNYEKKKYLSDNHIIQIFQTLCEDKNLNYTKESILKAITTIKNFSEETFEED